MAWGFLCLGLIAITSITQTVIMLTLAADSRRFMERMTTLEAEMRRYLLPQLVKMDRLMDNMRDLREGALRIEAQLEGSVHALRGSLGVVERLVLRPLGSVAAGLAILNGLRRGLVTLRRRALPAPTSEP